MDLDACRSGIHRSSQHSPPQKLDDFTNQLNRAFDHQWVTPALFVTSERDIGSFTLSASVRGDAHPEAGTQLTERVALLARPVSGWTVRGSVGTGFAAPTATSQDAVRALAWQLEGIAVHALPMRLVAHRGLRGQHNTPLHAIRTGGAFEQLDRTQWEVLRPRLDAWIAGGGGASEVHLGAWERILGSIARSAYGLLRHLRA